jgi:hypothetical protein
MREVHVCLHGVRAGKPVSAGLDAIEDPGILRNQHDEILTRIDGPRFDGGLELLLDVRIEVKPRAWLADSRRLKVGGRERRVCETTLTIWIKRLEPVRPEN